jgi:hypothetical protein
MAFNERYSSCYRIRILTSEPVIIIMNRMKTLIHSVYFCTIQSENKLSYIPKLKCGMLQALDMFWHEDCLKCGCCDCRLGEVGSTLYTKANLILCKRDYLRSVYPW